MSEFETPLTNDEVEALKKSWKHTREEWVRNNPEWEEHDDISPEELKNENKLGW